MLSFERESSLMVITKEPFLRVWAKKIAARSMGIVFSMIVIIMLAVAIGLEASIGKGFHAAVFALGAVILSLSLALNTRMPRTHSNYVTGTVGIVVTTAVLVSSIAFLVGCFAKNVDTLSMSLAFVISVVMFFVSFAWTIANLLPPTQQQNGLLQHQQQLQQQQDQQFAQIGDERMAIMNEARKRAESKAFTRSTSILNLIVTLLWIVFAVLIVVFAFEAVNSVADFYKFSPPDTNLVPIGNPTTTPTPSTTLSPTMLSVVVETDAPSKSPSATNATANPSSVPTLIPSITPSFSPVNHPTDVPTTLEPTFNPTKMPSTSPTNSPSKSPTRIPSLSPTISPSSLPTTLSPTSAPITVNPSASPNTLAPTQYPQTSSPSLNPTRFPTTTNPTNFPTQSPTKKPSKYPTTAFPTTASPTKFPTQPTSPTSSPTTAIEDERRVPHKIQIKCTGPENAPPPYVIFDANVGGTHVDWSWVQQNLTEHGIRSCAYSRSGLAYSQNGLHPRNSKVMASELNDLVSYLGFNKSPNSLVIVAQGTGAHTARVYEAIYGRSIVKGIVFINGIHPEEIENCDDQANPSYNSAIGLEAFRCSLGWTRAQTVFGQRLQLLNPYIPSLPNEVQSEATYAYTACTWYSTVFEEDAYKQISCGQAIRYASDKLNKKVIQLISEYTYTGTTQLKKKDDTVSRKLCDISSNKGVWKTIPNSDELSAIMKQDSANFIAREIINLCKE